MTEEGLVGERGGRGDQVHLMAFISIILSVCEKICFKKKRRERIILRTRREKSSHLHLHGVEEEQVIGGDLPHRVGSEGVDTARGAVRTEEDRLTGGDGGNRDSERRQRQCESGISSTKVDFNPGE